MDKFKVVFTARADSDLSTIESDARYSVQQSSRYVRGLRLRCRQLMYFPERFAEVYIRKQDYRSFVYKSHRVFYRIQDDRVIIVAILHNRQLPERRL